MISTMDSYPTLNRWQRLIRKLCGGQDIVAIVFVDTTTGERKVTWFSGVDMTTPVVNMNDGEIWDSWNRDNWNSRP